MEWNDQQLQSVARELGKRLGGRGEMLAVAESCTGGWLAKILTDISGSSGWFDCGFITYSNQAKQRMLGVDKVTLDANGAVSLPVVEQMAAGARHESGADLAVAISGIAGPGGGTRDKPVGTVCFAWVGGERPPEARSHRFDGDRESVRRQAVAVALQGLVLRL